MTVKTGIIGTGQMATIYADILKASPYASLNAFIGRSFSSCESVGSKYKCNAYPSFDWDKFFSHDFDLVVMAVDESVRSIPYEILAKLKDLHLYLEKPFATSLKDAILFRKLFSQHQGHIQVAHSLRSSPRFQALKNRIDHHSESPITISTRRNSNSLRVQRVLNRFNLEHWLLPHDIDMVTYITGQPINSVYAQSASPNLFSEHDYLRVIARLKDNCSVFIESLWTTLPTPPGSQEATFEVRTPTHIFTVNDTEMNVNTFSASDFTVSQPDTYEHFMVDGIYNGMFANSLNSFVSKICSDVSVDNNDQLNNAVYVASVCDAIHDSRTSNSIITF